MKDENETVSLNVVREASLQQQGGLFDREVRAPTWLQLAFRIVSGSVSSR
jgi:hypothetical protein